MEPFAKAFDQLRREYLAEGAARLSELRADIDRLRAADPDALGSLRTRFHRLVGSGGSYGFPEISSLARDAERRLGPDSAAAPDAADWLEDVVDQLAVRFTEAERLIRSASGEAPARLAIVAAPNGSLADDLQDALDGAGFTVRRLPPDARPDDIARPDAVQIAVLVVQGNATYAVAAEWSAVAAPAPRTVVLVEAEREVDRLRAAVAGAELVLPVERAASDLARLAQRHVLTSASRFVAVLADEATTRADALATGLASVGMEVRRADNAATARQHLELSVPDLVVASASLPDGGGRALGRLVRQDPRCTSVPVVLLGAVSAEDRLAALREGVDEVLTGAHASRTVIEELRARAERGRRVRELVRRDPLTGALNDAAFRSELDQAVMLARRDQRPLTILLIVLAGLSEVNAARGHSTGDRLLAHAGAVVRASVRQSDLVGRRGGRTFAVLLRGSPSAGAQKIAAKIRTMLADHPYETRDGGTLPLRVTISSASLGEQGTTADELMGYVERG